MEQKQCPKCGEMVGETKAFCPGCGYAFVEEEKRQSASNFDAMDSTVQLGNTMYNQMLSDMGLNLSKPAAAPEPRKAEANRIEVILPAAESPKVPKKAPPPARSSGNLKWFILAGALLLAIAALIIVIAAALIIYRPLLK